MNGVILGSVVPMVRHRSGPVVLAIAAMVFGVTTHLHAQYMSTRHVRDVVRDSTVTPAGRLPATQAMSLNIVLPLRDPAGLKLFLEDVYNPTSSSYRHFLTVPEFTERFGPPRPIMMRWFISQKQTASR
jgi:subtilase family serine protease